MNFKPGLFGAVMLWALAVGAQTTMFTYQGQLASGGSLVTGNFDLRFRLLDTNSDLIAGPVTNAPVGVTNGLFTTTMDFGATAFNGAARWLEVGVRTNGNPNAYTVLLPNQQLTSVPYAIRALNASNAVNAATLTAPLAVTNLSGIIPASQLSTNVALLSSNQTFTGANVFQGAVTATNPANSFGGSGAGLTSLQATNLTGTLPDTTLSANVPLFSANDNFSNNVTAVLFTGSGHGLTNVPGAFFWLTVNGTNATAGSNLGFIVTNGTAPVIITLPASPSVGDTFRVAGVGAGGWIIAQNAGQQMLAGSLADTTGLNWVQQTNSGVHNWTAITSSADGSRLIAATSAGTIFVSTNSGVTWVQTASLGANVSSVACSTSGSNVLATVGNSGTSGDLWTSPDGGNTWASHPYSTEWMGCAASANGSNLVAVSYTGYIYTSANAGGAWGASLYSNTISWTGVASSANGANLAAVSTASGGSYIFTSTNAGISWTKQTNSGLASWTTVASSADGTRLVAASTSYNSSYSGGIYASANGGVSWFQENQNNSEDWAAVTSSTDGSHLAAVWNTPPTPNAGYVYTSDNSGSTWVQRYGAPNAPWTAITGSADGAKLAAATYNGYIYTSGQGATTAGTAGYLAGGYQSTLELQYVGGGLFIPLSHEGSILAY